MRRSRVIDFFEDDLSSLLKRTKIHSLVRPIYEGIGTILMFHRVQHAHEKSILNRNIEVTPRYLESIIHYFQKRSYDFVSLDQVYEILTQGRKTKKKFVAFTFDDGYKDNYDNGYPVLKRHNVPFTVYISPLYAYGNGIVWWYSLEDLVMQNDKVCFEVDSQKFSFDCSKRDKKKESFLAMNSLFKNVDLPKLVSICDQIFTQNHIDFRKNQKKMFLEWESIREMSKDSLVTIGAHTMNHLYLSGLDQDVAKKEILNSKILIESIIKKPVYHFSFPYSSKGDITQREIGLAQECGLKTMTVVGLSNIFSQHKNYLGSLPRIPVFGGDEDVGFLDIYVSGFISMISNRFRRLIAIKS